MRGYQEFLRDPDAYVARMKGSMADVIEAVTGFVTNARKRCDQINLARLQPQEAMQEEEGSPSSNDQEKEPQPRKPDCKIVLFIFSIFEGLVRLI